MSWAECAICGHVFASVSGFDAHQHRQYGAIPPIVCLDPRMLGMEQDERGRWRQPIDADSRARLAKIRASEAGGGQVTTPQAPKTLSEALVALQAQLPRIPKTDEARDG